MPFGPQFCDGIASYVSTRKVNTILLLKQPLMEVICGVQCPVRGCHVSYTFSFTLATLILVCFVLEANHPLFNVLTTPFSLILHLHNSLPFSFSPPLSLSLSAQFNACNNCFPLIFLLGVTHYFLQKKKKPYPFVSATEASFSVMQTGDWCLVKQN